MKPGNTYPSDHFGVMADLLLGDDTSSTSQLRIGDSLATGNSR